MQSTPLADEVNDNIDPLPESDSDVFGNVERIDKKDIKAVNDPNCKHEFIEDPEDQTDYYMAMTCKHCPIGYLAPKKV